MDGEENETSRAYYYETCSHSGDFSDSLPIIFPSF